MQTPLRILLFALLCWCGYHAVRQTFQAYVPGWLSYIFFVITLILTITVIVLDIKAYRSFPKAFQFYSSIAGLFICAVVIFRLVVIHNMNTAATLFTAQKRSGGDVLLNLQFKENNYVVIEDMLTPLIHTYYGRYRYDKDSIFITHTNYDRFAKALPFSGAPQQNIIVWKNGDTMIMEKTAIPSKP